MPEEHVILTDLENMIEFRNIIAMRLTEWKCNKAFWEMKFKTIGKGKKKAEERTRAKDQVASHTKNIEADSLYLEVIDKLVVELQAEKSEKDNAKK